MEKQFNKLKKIIESIQEEYYLSDYSKNLENFNICNKKNKIYKYDIKNKKFHIINETTVDEMLVNIMYIIII